MIPGTRSQGEGYDNGDQGVTTGAGFHGGLSFSFLS